MSNPFVIAGPDDDYGVYQYWTVDGEWGDFSRAIHYGDELFAFPPGELPVGTAFIMDMNDYSTHSI
jgi:hypothetical protein